LDAQESAEVDKIRQLFSEKRLTVVETKSEEKECIGVRSSELERMRGELDSIRRDISDAEKYDTVIKIADKYAREAEKLKETSDGRTTVIEKIDAYKVELLKEIPIEGLEISDGDILVNGVKFDQLNTAQRLRIAVAVAVMRESRNKLPLIWVDGAEALDSQNYADMIAMIEKSGIQAVVARVTDGELKVVTE